MAFADVDAEEELLAKALYVDDEEDESGAAQPKTLEQFTSAEDYLRSVIREARTLESVKTGKRPVR